MIHVPRVAAAGRAEWADLVAELDRWEEAGRVARLWWRDDDAVAPSRALTRLLDLADGVPLALAVIPAEVGAELAAFLDLFPEVAILHHGWCHANRAADFAGDAKKSEYPAERHPVEVADELDEGRKRLRRLFGERALPVFVPPWNRFAPRFVPLLVEVGLTTLSQMAPRRAPAPPGIAIADVHLDVTAWHEGRGFIGADAALGRLVAVLQAHRLDGERSAIGLLTHHLVIDAATEDFIVRLVATLDRHRGARWVAASELVG